MSLDGLAHAIRAIGRPEFYEHVSDYLRSCLHFDNIVVIIFNGSRAPAIEYRKTYGPNVFKYIESDYLTGAYMLDPIYHYHLERGQSGIFKLLDIAPDQFKRSRYYEWYYGRIGISDEISVILTAGPDTTITISMGLDGTTGETFPAHAPKLLRAHEDVIIALLETHFARMVQLSFSDVDEYPLPERLISVVREQLGVTLSPRQAEVALFILRGHSSQSIALNANISAQTVKVFRKQLYKKCNISSQAELFAMFMPVLAQLTPVRSMDAAS
jgi:DNA-binding CsgD family transcriptional regulator